MPICLDISSLDLLGLWVAGDRFCPKGAGSMQKILAEGKARKMKRKCLWWQPLCLQYSRWWKVMRQQLLEA